MEKHIVKTIKEARACLDALMENQDAIAAISRAGHLLTDTFNKDGRVFSCGNGGSLCDAMHFAEELSGRFRDNRKALPAVSISDPGHLSCVANDYGYEHVFARYLEAHAKPGDCLLAISTSGKSANVIAAAKYARKHDVKVIVLTGMHKSDLGRAADIEICTPCGNYADRVQELHIKVIHILIELVERQIFPANYASESS